MPPSPKLLLDATSLLSDPGLPVFTSPGDSDGEDVDVAEVAISLITGLLGVVLEGVVDVLDVAAPEDLA